MSTWTIGKTFHFEASHVLWLKDISDEANAERFGQRSRYHGHSYKLTVEFKTDALDPKGMIKDYTDIGVVVNDRIIQHWDHYFLNELPDFAGMLTTAENISLRAYELLATMKPSAIIVKETESTYATYEPCRQGET